MARRRTLLIAAFAALLPASASAASPEGAAGTPDSGGAAFGELAERPEAPRRKARPRRERAGGSGRPVLRSFEVGTTRFYAYGRPARVRFRIDDRSEAVRVTLRAVRKGTGATIAKLDLGERPTGVEHGIALTGREGGSAWPQGAIELRLSARDPGGKGLRRGARASSTRVLEFLWHRFPVVGQFSYGGEGARFGAERPSHSHQGQDLIAAEGTPIVAPRGGVIQTVAYQAAGAGHYVILDGEGEDRDYAFMHLQTGSIPVRTGQRVATGDLLGRVGSTGASSGPHLHFEIWENGGWYEGGRPVDPLPYLRRWE